MNNLKTVNGNFTTIEGQLFYKIENYDYMEDFFMTITSSSDVWNFCWSHGGITAGRKDCDHAVFPYYTADKIADAKTYTGPYTAIAVIKDGQSVFWEPFTETKHQKHIFRNIYKNISGTQVIFEEVNTELQLTFQNSWTSSDKFGLVRKAQIINNSTKKCEVTILDGCRNILPACCTADFQNNNSVLLDAYKKTDLDTEANLAIFSVSSIVTDKAEPSEGLLANVCWFSTEDKIILSPNAPEVFTSSETILSYDELPHQNVIKGQRPACYICKKVLLSPVLVDGRSNSWLQIFDTSLDMCRILELKEKITNRNSAIIELQNDINKTLSLMEEYITKADGIQDTEDTMSCVHHRANVMFNIMRGGIFENEGKIEVNDFINFLYERNKIIAQKVEADFTCLDHYVSYKSLEQFINKFNLPQLTRLFLEYLPLTFSRRHGDPSRPWNRFSINLRNEEGTPILDYEGNWRDIFQNWEALLFSYPEYAKNVTAKFLNAMTIDGFNPGKISRKGVQWDVPEPNNPWAQIGYWGDHQVIYLQKLLEFFDKSNSTELIEILGQNIFSSTDVPYRLKTYSEILKDPRNSIYFDRELNTQIEKNISLYGGDMTLVKQDKEPALVNMTTKLLQLVISKIANLIPGGGIWLNTQRPEWNDANNALAGYGLSVVTLCYLRRYVSFLIKLFSKSTSSYELPEVIFTTIESLNNLLNKNPPIYAEDSIQRKKFTDTAGTIFEKECQTLYRNGYGTNKKQISQNQIMNFLQNVLSHIDCTININKRNDGLYHSYNTMKVLDDRIEVLPLQEMLEGQVAVLSSGLLQPDAVIDVMSSLKQSHMFENRQYSYMLYPDKELPFFEDKNNVPAKEIKEIEQCISKTGIQILRKDINGNYHFNPLFRNARVMLDYITKMDKKIRPEQKQIQTITEIYEKTFKHQSFTGRSGTFYAYEGLGSIYWHMVSKLLLAVQENVYIAFQENNIDLAKKLTNIYYDVRKGLGYNKTPELYGAFPFDPYSHTPAGQGAKQPGMTGQVKEEVLTRWGELGIIINNGTVCFNPILLQKTEFHKDGTLTFTWCGVEIKYIQIESDTVTSTITIDGKVQNGNSLSKEQTIHLFAHDNSLKKIEVTVNAGTLL